ncbi:MAG: DUF29 domain-containing protein [Alphaproteobacteria bacterium]|nr:DUF29 domain-containing protein [Alphaproteobacteria bacterium]
MATTLYDKDYVAWTRAQAKTLRRMAEARVNVELDCERLAEEVEDLGKSERDAVRSLVTQVLEHLLKIAHSSAAAPVPGWRREIRAARQSIGFKLTPSLRRDLDEQFEALYAIARASAADAFEAHADPKGAGRLPASSPFTLEQVLDAEWWPRRETAA